MGAALHQFRQDLETHLNSNVALVGSGTAALHLALILSGMKQGDEVFCSSLTFAASANPILYCGATPVFIDSDPETWNISPELLEKGIVDRKKKGGRPKAVIVVDLYGMPCDYDAIKSICKKHELVLIEDAAESLGSTYHGKPAGSFGDLAILSFNANKIITTGGGGALVSADKSIVEHALNLSAQARRPAEYYLHAEIGYNYRMNNIAAAMGMSQFKSLPERVAGRRRVFEHYKSIMSNHEIDFQKESDQVSSNRWLSTFILPTKKKSESSWEPILLALREENIEARPIWKPLHTQPIFEKSISYLNGTAERIFNHGICLPSNSKLPTEDLNNVYEKIKSFL